MTRYIPWGDIRAVCVQNVDFVTVEAHGLQVDMSNGFNYTVHQKHISLDDFKPLKASGPNRRVPDPNVFRPPDEPVGDGAIVEIGRWSGLGIEGTTPGLDFRSVEWDLRAVIPLWKVGEPITEECKGGEGTEGKKLDE